MRDWIQVGGQISEQELKNDLLMTLPMEIRESLMWRVQSDDVTFPAFVTHVRATAEDILFIRGQSSLPARTVDEQYAEPEAPQKDESYEEAIAAVNARWKGKGGRKGDSKGDRGGKGGDREAKCGNCGGAHLTAACSKPRIAMEDRLCHGCGKPGHVRAICPNNRKGVKAANEPSEEPDCDFGCVIEKFHDESAAVQHSIAAPEPAAARRNQGRPLCPSHQAPQHAERSIRLLFAF